MDLEYIKKHYSSSSEDWKMIEYLLDIIATNNSKPLDELIEEYENSIDVLERKTKQDVNQITKMKPGLHIRYSTELLVLKNVVKDLKGLRDL